MRVCALFVSLRLCVEKIFPMSHGGGRDGSRPYERVINIYKIVLEKLLKDLRSYDQ